MFLNIFSLCGKITNSLSLITSNLPLEQKGKAKIHNKFSRYTKQKIGLKWMSIAVYFYVWLWILYKRMEVLIVRAEQQTRKKNTEGKLEGKKPG